MSVKKIIFLVSLFLFISSAEKTKAQTTLAAGDLLFTSFNGVPAAGTAPDTFSFVLFTPVSASTVIYFTERGYKGSNTWQASGPTEGTISWTANTALSAGTEVQIAGLGTGAATVNGTAVGTVATVAGGHATTGLSLSNAGDQVIAFQGGSGDPASGSSTMIAGISWHLNCGTTTIAGWNGTGCTYGPQSSAMPPGLTGGTNAFLAGTGGATTNNSHGKFNCTGTPYSSIASLKTAILSTSNWSFSSSTTTVIDIPSACGSFYVSCTNPVITANPANRAICRSSNTTFSVTATGATAYQWQVNTGSGFTDISNTGVYSNATTASLTITSATSTMNGYQYRCVAKNGSCNTTSNAATLTVSNIYTSYSTTNIACFGTATGSASIITSGGIAPYSYSWSPSGGTNATAISLTAGTYTCTITDAIGCTATRTVTINHVATALLLNEVSRTNVSCNGGANGSATVAASGGAPSYTYSWSPSGGTGSTATGLSAGTYTCTVTDSYGCTATKSVTISQPAAISVTKVVTNVSCNGGADGAINLTVNGGTPTYTYSWGDDISTEDRTGLVAGSYSVVITDANGCSKTENITITQPANTTGSNSYNLPTVYQSIEKNVTNYNYVTSSCELINAVTASGASPVSGIVTSKVWIENSVLTDGAIPFVQRHYEITPATNASTVTGTVTLFFTQAEFDNFNVHPNSTINLPSGAADALGKANLRIAKYSGTSNNGSGLPASYSNAAVIIDPDDANIVWNATASAWEITFNVTGFSGFVVQTLSSTLPVAWQSFTVKKQYNHVLLNWQTTAEQNTEDFVIQHSTDGQQWQQLGIVAAAGNSTTLNNYQFAHNKPVNGNNYYRLLQRDKNGASTYSAIETVQFAAGSNTFTVKSNSVTNGMLRVVVTEPTTLRLFTSNGQLLQQYRLAQGNHTLTLSAYTKGIYFINGNGKTERLLIQ